MAAGYRGKDMTVGSPMKLILFFSIPLLIGNIFQQLYNMVDTIIVGRCIDENALAAVGNSYEITLIFIAFAFGCNIGCSVIVSQLFGAREYKNMKTAVTTSMISSAVLCTVLVAAGVLLALVQRLREIRKGEMDDAKNY